MAEVYIIAAVRTPIGIGKPEAGALYPVAPVDLAAHVLREVVRRAGAEPARVEDVILGIVTPVGDQGANLARLASLQAGFPPHVPAVSLNRMCGSSQQAVHFGALAILAGTQLLGLPIERYALINVAVLIVLIGVCLKLIPAYRKRRAAADAAVAAAS